MQRGGLRLRMTKCMLTPAAGLRDLAPANADGLRTGGLLSVAGSWLLCLSGLLPLLTRLLPCLTGLVPCPNRLPCLAGLVACLTRLLPCRTGLEGAV